MSMDPKEVFYRKRCEIPLECVWIEYFNEAIHFFEEFIFLCNEMLCLDREIKKHFKCKHFF